MLLKLGAERHSKCKWSIRSEPIDKVGFEQIFEGGKAASQDGTVL